MKPDWSKAPEWAKWWAVDSSGASYWYEVEPTVGVEDWRFTTHTKTRLDDTSMQPDWRETLHKQPKDES